MDLINIYINYSYYFFKIIYWECSVSLIKVLDLLLLYLMLHSSVWKICSGDTAMCVFLCVESVKNRLFRLFLFFFFLGAFYLNEVSFYLFSVCKWTALNFSSSLLAPTVSHSSVGELLPMYHFQDWMIVNIIPFLEDPCGGRVLGAGKLEGELNTFYYI